MDGQIFAVQEHGGISRMFVELADQFIHDPDLGVSLEPLSMVTRNHYLLSESRLAEQLRVRPARWQHLTLARYLARPHRAMHADVVHSTFYLTRALRDFPGRPHVVTVHDMIPELFPESRRRADRITDKRRYVDRLLMSSVSQNPPRPTYCAFSGTFRLRSPSSRTVSTRAS